MTQQEYKEQVININKNKHRPLLQTLVEGRKQFMKQSKTDKNNIIIYYSSTKLPETTGTTIDSRGIHINKFSGKNGELTITNHTFKNGIGTIEFNEIVTSIGDYAFSNSTAMTGIEIPDSVTSIGIDAFYNCDSLLSINIPDSVITIQQKAFENCDKLTSVYISCNVKNIWFQTFYKCKNLSSVTFGSSSIVIGDEAFRECGFTSLVIPDSVTAIGYGAFESCNNLTSAIIGNGVTSIGNGIFSFCNKLTNITIGSNVTNIANQISFSMSENNITSITSLVTTAPTITNTTFQAFKTGGTLYVPSGSTGYDAWMGTGNYYLGKYNWTKVEQ